MQAKTESAAQARSHVERARRYTLLLRAAKLIAPGGDYLCVLRDVSATGLKLRLFHPLPDGEELAIDLGNGQTHEIVPVWQTGGHAGFRFSAGQVDIAPLLQGSGPFPRRAVRLKAERPAVVATPTTSQQALLRDISLDGARIDCDWSFAIGQRLQLDVVGFPRLHAKVRWRRGGTHGLTLERHFGLDELARLLAGERLPTVDQAAEKLAAR